MTTKYTSLEAIRLEKQKAKRQIEQSTRRLKTDLAENYMPPANSLFRNSSNKYMNYVGYAITAYKVFLTLRKAYSFVSKLR
ncbi:MAG: hypothetical protein IJR02_02175 [Bacteroidaceae bacterium]|jgi:hypothetical protein|nr:hypothetical protein [Bacteroidaceae bacterium]